MVLPLPRPTHGSPRWIVVGGTDRGRRRSRNEDSCAILPDHGIAVVADGMGGHPGGDVASAIAAHTTAQALRRALEGTPAPHEPTPEGTPEHRERAMRASVLEAHRAIRSRGRSEPDLAGMGTTTTALLMEPDGAYTVGNVGDSRVYRYRAGRLTQLTRDDTWLQQGIDTGRIAREEAAGHPEGHLLTQCLGLATEPVPSILQGNARPADVFLLCSDGLVACLPDGTVTGLLDATLDGTAEGVRRAVATLIDEANAAGGIDNITVVLLALPPDLSPPTSG